jgi:Fe-Mn family superoxide dismutase
MPRGLDGISDGQIEDHWGLYKGYVTQTNALRKELADMRAGGQGAGMAYADRRRRFGFEYNGMVLHEYYFGNLTRGASADMNGAFAALAADAFGGFDNWKADFVNAGKTRGIGWAICYYDPMNGEINNHFVQLHEDGNVASFQPLVVMDVFEHAYMIDYKAAGRPTYIEAFMKNINWPVIEQRIAAAKGGQIVRRF